MLKRLEKGLIYDIELYRNMLMVGFYSLQSQSYRHYCIYHENKIDEREALFDLVQGRTLIGYNNWNYDDAVLNHLLENNYIGVEELWQWSQGLLSGGRNPYRYMDDPHFSSYDLSELIRIGPVPKKLKLVGCNLKHHKLQDLPIDYLADVKPDEFELLKKYNENDLEITYKVYKHLEPRLEMREILSEAYKLDLYSVSDTTIVKKYINKNYQEKTGNNYHYKKRTEHGDIPFSEIVYDYIEFETDELNDFLTFIKSQTLFKQKQSKDKPYKWDYKLTVGDLVVSVGLGGIHSVDKPLVLAENDKWCILDIDVASQYPSAIVNNNLCPKHLDPNVFVPLMKNILDERLRNKKLYKLTGEKKYWVFQQGLKISANSVYGLLSSPYFFLFDQKVTYTVTINNQLMMLMLIEMLQLEHYKVISANTDGITLYVLRDQLDAVRNIYKHWEKRTKFKLEEAFYTKLIRRDINNYLALVEDGSVKAKGCFLLQKKKELSSGYEYPIIAIALHEYFLNNIPYETAIKEHSDIYDFTRCEKTSNQFTNYLQKIERVYKTHYGKDLSRVYDVPKTEDEVVEENKTQDSVRFYVSLPKTTEYTEPGYLGYKQTGCSLKKKKMRDGKRYEVVRTTEGEKGYQIKDMLLGNVIEGVYPTKIKASEDCRILNQNNEGNETIQVEQVQDYVAGRFVTLFNDYFESDDYNIDYDFYIGETKKIVDKIERKNETTTGV